MVAGLLLGCGMRGLIGGWYCDVDGLRMALSLGLLGDSFGAM